MFALDPLFIFFCRKAGKTNGDSQNRLDKGLNSKIFKTGEIADGCSVFFRLPLSRV
jgi:hypothetical protein